MHGVKFVEEEYQLAQRRIRLKRIANLDELVGRVSDALFAEDERLPYWAELWPSAIGFIRFADAQPSLFKDRTVLELGCGLGLTTIAISLQRPEKLLATDYEPQALEMTRQNFVKNQLSPPELQLIDWRHPDLNTVFDRIAASDVIYEERFFQPLIDLFNTYLAPGGKIVLAEPNRSVAQKFFRRLMHYGYMLHEKRMRVVQAGRPLTVSVYIISK
ncbi:MAG: methyltransferase domain-containing protein [Caldithrix sp.]|nr:methyltransferase domain-containing protein [Caldithrix sp.]